MGHPAIETGLKLHQSIMVILGQYIGHSAQLVQVGRMIDILIGSAVADALSRCPTEEDRKKMIVEYTREVEKKLETLLVE
jgi:hypothetical protein